MAIGWGRILSYSCLLTWLRLEVCLSFNTLSPYIYILTGDNHTHHIRSAIMQSATRDIMANKHIHFKMSAYSYQHTKSSSSLHERWVGLLRFVGEIKPEEVLIWNWWLGIIRFLICICNATARQHRHWLTITSTTFHLVKNPSGLLWSRGRLYWKFA